MSRHAADAFGWLVRTAEAEASALSGRREARELVADLQMLAGSDRVGLQGTLRDVQSLLQGEIRRRDRRIDETARLGMLREAARQRGATASLEAADLALEEILRGEASAYGEVVPA